MHKNLVSFLDTNNIITKHQFGFRPGLSTFLALNQLHNCILRLNESGQYTCSIFLDLKKALDTANHKVLLDKLNDYRIRGLASHHINRIDSQLCRRRGCGECKRTPQKFWFGENPGKICENLWKLSQNPCKYEQKWRPMYWFEKNGAQKFACSFTYVDSNSFMRMEFNLMRC